MSTANLRYPTQIQKAFQAFWQTQALTTALRLDLFTTLDIAPMAAPTLAAKLGCATRGTHALLDGLVALGLVVRDAKGLFKNSEEAALFLVKGKPEFLGQAGLGMNELEIENWVLLDEAVKTGQPVAPVPTSPDAGEIWPMLVDGMRIQSRMIARHLVELLDVAKGYPNGIEAIDVGGGLGSFGLTIAAANRKASITQIDQPAINALAQKAAEEAGVAGQFKFVNGDYRTLSLGEDYYDLAVVSNVTRIESPQGNQDLFTRINKSLVEDGILVISDCMLNDDGNGPSEALLQSLNMLLYTTEGGAYSESQYREWLLAAGFQSVEVHPMPGALTLTIAEK